MVEESSTLVSLSCCTALFGGPAAQYLKNTLIFLLGRVKTKAHLVPLLGSVSIFL